VSHGEALASAPLLFVGKWLASPSVDEMQPGASWADDHLILGVGNNLWIIIRLVLDAEIGYRANEN
jgi:hypothetical protein